MEGKKMRLLRNKGRVNLAWIMGLAASARLAIGGVCLADTHSSSRRSSACDGGGGDVPVPYANTNQHVELADGENYTLVGIVRFMGGLPYLQVDLQQHPWLATADRVAYPYYSLFT